LPQFLLLLHLLSRYLVKIYKNRVTVIIEVTRLNKNKKKAIKIIIILGIYYIHNIKPIIETKYSQFFL